MRTLSDTITRLSAMSAAAGRIGEGPAPSGRLTALPDFGSNPGALRGWIYCPPQLAANAPLVVVLHGCTQTAAGYDIGAGWSTMADRHGFALLFPEQQRANNPNLCFNWFAPEDHRRGGGEALSIRQMIAAVVDAQRIDPARIFVTGLSAGGAMAMTMLATYPEVFAGGAVIAGLPYGSATSVPQAFDAMRGHGGQSDVALERAIADASDHAGPWPTLSVWQGSADRTVHPDNADRIVAQWRALHRLPPAPTRIEQVDGQTRQLWYDAAGRVVVESYAIAGMGHGTPLARGVGVAGAYMLDVGISSTEHVCRAWGLAVAGATATIAPRRDVVAAAPPVTGKARRLHGEPIRPRAAAPTSGVGAVIENALRAAGLMR